MEEDSLTETIAGAPVQGAHRLRHATETGAWLTVQPFTLNGKELVAQEWRDVLFLRYGQEPPDLPHYCDVCNVNFSICHAFHCKRGGLVTARHNELRGGVADLAGNVFTPSHVRGDHIIFAGCAMKRPKANPFRTKGTTVPYATPPLETTEYKGNLLIRDLWHNGTDSIHGMCVVKNMPSIIRRRLQRSACRRRSGRKIKKYLEAYIQQRRNFSPFVASIDGLLGVEAPANLKRIVSRLAKSGGKPTHGRADTSRVRLPSLWCGRHTGASEGPG